MGVLNLVLQGNMVKYCATRFTFDGSCFQLSDSGFFELINDSYDGFAYNILDSGADAAISWLDGKGYPHGSKEDIAPSVEQIAWLAAEEARGRAGIESKSDIYVRFLVDYPGTTCIQAI